VRDFTSLLPGQQPTPASGNAAWKHDPNSDAGFDLHIRLRSRYSYGQCTSKVEDRGPSLAIGRRRSHQQQQYVKSANKPPTSPRDEHSWLFRIDGCSVNTGGAMRPVGSQRFLVVQTCRAASNEARNQQPTCLSESPEQTQYQFIVVNRTTRKRSVESGAGPPFARRASGRPPVIVPKFTTQVLGHTHIPETDQ